MTLKMKILLGAAVALVVFFLVWRRRAQAAQAYGVTAATPAPVSAITALQTGVQQLPGLATQAAIDKVGQILPPIIGQGLTSIIPQSKPQPVGTTYTGQACPAGAYVDPATGKCGTNRLANILNLPAVKAIASTNYNPAAGYYG